MSPNQIKSLTRRLLRAGELLLLKQTHSVSTVFIDPEQMPDYLRASLFEMTDVYRKAFTDWAAASQLLGAEAQPGAIALAHEQMEAALLDIVDLTQAYFGDSWGERVEQRRALLGDFIPRRLVQAKEKERRLA